MLSETEFIIAMHLLASYREGSLRALPHNLPAGLYEAAARRGIPPPRPLSGSRQPPNVPTASAIPRQFSGSSSQRPSSPLARQPYTAAAVQPQPTASTGDWVINPQEKAQYDGQFDSLDSSGKGFVTGEQAVGFFSNSRLPEDDLAQIWDLADIKSEGQLNKDEFAVAMYLIRQQLARRGPLPTTLPVNLIPPSMRSSVTQQQPQAPRAVPQSPPPKAKSAAEDLFGLDALATPAAPAPAAQVPQSTGGSSAAAAFPNSQPSSSPQPPVSQATTFKPFIPSSSFGQSIISPQPTGMSQGPTSRAPPQTNDDLLGDTDPEINERITNETTELANLSNQVGNLTNQMQDVKNKRGTTEQNMSQVNAQKRDFETRLTQLRTAYEQEARDLRGLEDSLAASRNETKKIQADLAMVQHSYSSLQEQKQQVQAALEADQKENTSLKERMRQLNIEVGQIKPQIEKMRSDARQQKGLVAINKKQLSANEAERDRAKNDLDSATDEYQEATKELEESNKSLERQKSASALPVSPLPASSPAPSTTSQSTNPFFRRTTTGLSQQESARSPFAPESAASPNHSAFDSFFGTAMPVPSPYSPPTQAPPTSFGVTQPYQGSAQTPPSDLARSASASPALVEPKTPTQHDLPSATQLLPPPPQSRQITSSSLPLRDSVPGPASESSSVGVAPPASRFGDASGVGTPLTDLQVSQASQGHAFSPLSQNVTGESAQATSSSQGSSLGFATPQESGHIPGSFPGEEPSVATPVAAESPQHANSEDPFAIPHSASKEPASAKDDFDSAFAGFNVKGKAPDTSDIFSQPNATKRDEFPPIQEFDNDDDSSSESEKGFDDNFAPPVASFSAHDQETAVETSPVAEHTASTTTELRPEIFRNVSTASQLPTPNAQVSPPTYEQTVPTASADGSRKDSNQFPAEYTGLLPSRDDPTSPETTTSNPTDTPQSSSDAQASGTAVYSPPNAGTPVPEPASVARVFDSKPVAPPKNAFDDFEDAFGDLSEAKAADEKGDDEFGTQRDNNYSDEFNPTFDSPAPSKATTSSVFQDNAFSDFEPSVSSSTHGVASDIATPQPASNTDWDFMFAGLGDNSTQANGSSSQHLAPTNNGAAGAPIKPALGRAISTGTDHDDPILKRLTAMGYPREESLAALEKFDYNLDKARSSLLQDDLVTNLLQAADYLTSKA